MLDYRSVRVFWFFVASLCFWRKFWRKRTSPLKAPNCNVGAAMARAAPVAARWAVAWAGRWASEVGKMPFFFRWKSGTILRPRSGFSDEKSEETLLLRTCILKKNCVMKRWRRLSFNFNLESFAFACFMGCFLLQVRSQEQILRWFSGNLQKGNSPQNGPGISTPKCPEIRV